MLTVHLLGHAHVTYNNRPVLLSTKAVALITYLTIEKLPQHRERLADLLWNTPEARKNLRVELARIRSAGLNIFPLSRQLLYLENVETDLNVWLTQLGTELDQAGLAQWLSTLRGVPLSGLEDLGSPAFQEWTDHQRWVLIEQTEEVLTQAYERFHRAGKPWAARAIAARAEALGFTHPGEFLSEPEKDARPSSSPLPQTSPSGFRTVAAGIGVAPAPGWQVSPSQASVPDVSVPEVSFPETSDPGPAPDAPLHFSAPGRETALRDSLRRAAHKPQVVVLHGPTGSGKSYEADHALNGEGWLALRVSNSRVGRLVLATLAQSLLAYPSLTAPVGEAQTAASAPGSVDAPASANAQILRDVLLHPGSLEEDVVKVATVLATVPRPVAIVLDHAHNGPVELASLLEFLLNVPAAAPRALIMLSRTPPSQAPLCRALLRRFGTAQSLLLEVTPLSLGSVMRALETRGLTDLHAQAAVMLQRSGGNALHLLSLLEQAGPEAPGGQAEPGQPVMAVKPLPGTRLPTAMRDTYLGEIDGWPAPLRDALSSLSVIQGDFSYRLVGSFPDAARASLSPAALLREALAHRALVEAELPSALGWPGLGPVDDGGRGELCYRFRSEGLRIALSSLLSQTDRQELRRHLAGVLEAAQPGLALYYAERADAPEDAERLRQAYRAHLPAGSPLLRPFLPVVQDGLQVVQDGALPAAQRTPVQVISAPVMPPPAHHLDPRPEPRRSYASASAAVPWQGYLLSWEQGGWLSVLSQGRYGQPHTLNVHLPIASSLRDAPSLTLRVVWRLDVFHGGHELGPNQASFPLRFCVPGADGARVLTPEDVADYTEEGLSQQVVTNVVLGNWMEHELTFNVAGKAPERLDLAVRALDLALTIGELSLNGQPLLPMITTPEHLGVLGSREALPALHSLAARGQS
ncbi:AAA family ATPase [Deinococcus arenicola]|uniref:SARP family transcriptional regulator n=1 Tax=Deinococcus arenicola TaxID=2994950 RepID=A0ABU4DU87_9DEIO|nr:AAA family ATPase [Deinococcus sp. ZS9-10]MDV6375991.1 SARP family transcriptional regulator [Deinococcus sp. ZS9-10]